MLSWPLARRVGAGLWLTDGAVLKERSEALAKAQFARNKVGTIPLSRCHRHIAPGIGLGSVRLGPLFIVTNYGPDLLSLP